VEQQRIVGEIRSGLGKTNRDPSIA